MGTAVLALRMALAAVFAVAAVAKLRDLEGSRRAVRDFGVPERAAATAGVLLPLAELATAVCLVVAPSARWAAVAALALLLAFMAGIANALRRGEAPDCHCFGQIHSAPVGRGTLVRNAVLAGLAVIVIAEAPGPAVDDWVSARSGAELVAVGAGIFAAAAGLLSLWQWREMRRLQFDLATVQRIAAGAPPGIPIGSPAPDFSLTDLRGDTVTLQSLRERGQPILLVFVSPGCDSCVELLPQLARWQRTLAERLTIALISGGKARDHEAWEELGLEDILLQDRYELIEAYRIRGTPSAVIVTLEGTVGSNPAESVYGIEPLIRLALRDGAGSLVQGSDGQPPQVAAGTSEQR
jgi:peroxiredoxin